MIKWRKYLKRCPFRDKISVEKAEQLALRLPFGDGIWIEKYYVPNGTPWRMRASVFYRYYIPKGIASLNVYSPIIFNNTRLRRFPSNSP